MDSKMKVTWYRTPIPKQTLNALTERSNWRGIAFMVLHFSIIIATGAAVVACAFAGYWIAALALLVLHGAMFSFLGYAGLGHELFHRTVFASRVPNDLMLAVVSFLTWNNY